MNKMTDKMNVVFCDDNDTTPFWGSSENPRAGFSDDDWGKEWKIYRMACPGDSNYSWTQRFSDAIDTLETGNPVYVVTDANFGTDTEGGSNLLKKLCAEKKLVSGVVFSTELPGCSYPGIAPICEILDDRSETVAAKIRHYLLTGEIPDPDPETQIQSLSRAIHRLESLVSPIRYDVEILSENADFATDIWNDYFEKLPSDEFGYLTKSRLFGDGRLGIEKEIAYTLESIQTVPDVENGEYWKRACPDNALDAKTVEKQMGFKDARDNAEFLKENRTALRSTLEGVKKNICDLSQELRELRDRLEKKEKGSNS